MAKALLNILGWIIGAIVGLLVIAVLTVIGSVFLAVVIVCSIGHAFSPKGKK